MAARIALTVGGVVLCGLATALYIGAQFGRGPRDGLMTGLARRTGSRCGWCAPASRSRSSSSGCCSAACSASARSLYALGIGPLTQLMLPWFTVGVAVARE